MEAEAALAACCQAYLTMGFRWVNKLNDRRATYSALLQLALQFKLRDVVDLPPAQDD